MQERLTRKQFLKLLSGVGLLGILGLGVESEIKKDAGFETADGTWLGVYEIHNVGYDSKDIPPDVDVFYSEFTSITWPHSSISRLSALVSPEDEQIGLMNRREWERYANGEFDFVLADIATPDDLNLTQFDTVELGFALSAATALETIIEQLVVRDVQYTRRAIVSGMFLGWAALPTVANLVSNLGNTKEKSIQNRLSDRVGAILKSAHPRALIVDFRSALTALKLMQFAKHKQQELGRKPLTVIHSGSYHANIEEFIQAGENFTRRLVEVYLRLFAQLDPEWLQNLVIVNSGAEVLASTRVFSSDFKTTAEEIEGLFQDGMSLEEWNRAVYRYQLAKHETRYYDEQLLSLLQELLD